MKLQGSKFFPASLNNPSEIFMQMIAHKSSKVQDKNNPLLGLDKIIYMFLYKINPTPASLSLLGQLKIQKEHMHTSGSFT